MTDLKKLDRRQYAMLDNADDATLSVYVHNPSIVEREGRMFRLCALAVLRARQNATSAILQAFADLD